MKRVMTEALIERFKRYHNEHPTWGSMHAVLEDQNMLDMDVKWAINYASDKGDFEGAQLAAILVDFTPAGRFLIACMADSRNPATIAEAITRLNDAFQHRTLGPEEEFGIVGKCVACHREVVL